MSLEPDKSAFLEFLEYLGRPGQVVKNTLGGRGESALRHYGQMGLDGIDAFLPGDWLPNDVARPEDDLSGRELIGADDDFMGNVAGFGIDMVTDPLTYVPGAVFAKGAKGLGSLAKTGASKVVGPEAVDAGLRHVRRTFGAERLKPATRELLNRSRAAQGNEAKSGMEAIKAGALSKLSNEEAEIVGDLMDNVSWQNGQAVGDLVPGSTSALQRLGAHPGVNPANLGNITAALNEAITIGQNQAKRPNVFYQRGAVSDLESEYLPRVFKGEKKDHVVNRILGDDPTAMGAPNPVKARKTKSAADIAATLAAEPGLAYERNAVTRMAARAQAQGTLSQRAEIGKSLVGDGFAYADPESRKAANDIIRKMAETDPEDAKALHDAFSGLKPRGAVTEFLSKANRLWKPQIVYGLAIPKIGSIVRNKLGGAWQALSNPEARGVAGKQLATLDSDIVGAIADTLGMKYPRDRMVGDLKLIDDAFKQSGGAASSASAFLKNAQRGDLAEMVELGVLDGFVSSEDLLSEIARSPLAQKATSVMDWPGRIFRGVEDRLRSGMYKDLVARGKPPADAARIVKDSVYDYSIGSAENRLARDVVPFFTFTAKAIPQQAKFLAEKPYLAAALNHSISPDGIDDPTYEYMDGRLNIPLGNNQYVSGMGLPFEALNSIPNFSGGLREMGRDIEKNIVGASQPLLKTAFGAVSGEDPNFQSPFGTYSKIPLIGEAGEAGRIYNQVAGAGLPFTSPADTFARTAGKAFNEDRSLGVRALDMLTGANVVTVDTDRAIQQRLTRALEQSPDVRQVRTPINMGQDDDVDAMLNSLRDVKARLKAKRDAEAAKATSVL